MPSKPKETLTEKVLRLEAEVKSKNLQIAALNRTPKRKGRKLIPRPEGQAGRAYNVQKKMGLQKDKDRFCRLSRILRSYTFKYLDPHKTIRKQEPARVEKLLKLIMKQFKLFSRFQGGWPAYDLIKKVLQNSVRSLKADRAAEALAEEEDSDSEEDQNARHRRIQRAATTTIFLGLTMSRRRKILQPRRMMKVRKNQSAWPAERSQRSSRLRMQRSRRRRARK
ncbi:hypothetical protein B0H19DRAFT_580895 [Mycena capillaripes]|nr:hypothetical protein B0H19DRAFT_580895 [Mycena capillaripes]